MTDPYHPVFPDAAEVKPRKRPVRNWKDGLPMSYRKWLRYRLMKEYGDSPVVCSYCGTIVTEESATIDHIVALSKGGSKGMANLALACRSCNTRKKDKYRRPLFGPRKNKEGKYK